MILQVNDESVVIVELDKQGFYTRGVEKTVMFSGRGDSSFNFSSGVFVTIEHFPLNETTIQEIKSRLEQMMSMEFIEYSLTSPKKFNCQTFVNFIKTGRKNCSDSEVNTTSKSGKQGKGMIFVVNFYTWFINKLAKKFITSKLHLLVVFTMYKRIVKRKLHRIVLLIKAYSSKKPIGGLESIQCFVRGVAVSWENLLALLVVLLKMYKHGWLSPWSE